MIRSRAVAAAIVCLLAPSRAGAHEIGKTQVLASFRADGSYVIEVVVDPDALLTRLEASSGRPISSRLDRLERDRRIASFSDVFLAQVTIRFGDAAASPAFEYVPASRLSDAVLAPSTVRLTGMVPRAAETMTFSYGLAMGSYAMVVRLGSHPPQTLWLEAGHPSEPISLTAPPPPSGSLDIARQYLLLGFTHIVPNGVDHILFVFGIFLLNVRWRPLLAQISAFTIAHSITLGLTMYGVVSLPARIVEPMIALSIAYVAAENLLTSQLKPWRLALIFSFGLLHGMGFAGVLRELGLPRSNFLQALVAFNAGVEAGQLAVILAAAALIGWWRTQRPNYRRLVVQPASLAIGLTGLYWTVHRAFF
jgi:hypothetical protein